MKPEEWPRLALTAIILLSFAVMLVFHYSVGLEETLKNIVVISVGYWLGASKSGADNGLRMDKALDLAKSATAGDDASAIQSGDSVTVEKK